MERSTFTEAQILNNPHGSRHPPRTLRFFTPVSTPIFSLPPSALIKQTAFARRPARSTRSS